LKNPKNEEKTSHPKSTAKSRIWGTETPEPIDTKFCMSSAVYDVITPANFVNIGYEVLVWRRVEFWPFPLTCFVAFKTLSHYRASV